VGLLYPSRKVSDWQVQKSGPVLRYEEKHEPRLVRSTTAGDHTVLTVPQGFKATILQVLHYSVAVGNLIYFVRADDSAIYGAFVPAATDFLDFKTWTYEEAPVAYSTIKLDIQSAALTSTDLNILYVLEPASESYFRA